MEFNSKQEDIYEKLVGKSKYGKEVQVKYELTRPRKKQKKKNDTTRFEIVQQLNRQEGTAPVSEEVYSVPPDEDDLEDDDFNDSIDDDSVEVPPPPPRSDSLIPSETSSLSSNELAAPINETYQEVSDNVQNVSNLYQEVTNSQSNSAQSDKDENIYAPRNWRQQNYESWTPFFKSSAMDDPPPPTKAPPKPPVIKVPSNAAPLESVQKEKSRRERGYETWTPLASSDPPPPTQHPPKPPGQSSPQPKKHQSTSSDSTPRPTESIHPPSQIVHGAPLIPAPATQPAVQSTQQPPIYSQSTKRQFLATPKQITGLKKMGQPTPFLSAQSQEEPRKPSRPAPKPPVSKPQVITATSNAQVTEGDIRLSPIKDSLPSPPPSPVPKPEPTMELEEHDPDRLYEPCNWRRQLKDACAEEMYGVTGDMTDILPPPPEPEPLGGSVAFARAPLRKSKSILKKPADGGEKKKKVRMLFPSDTVTPI